MSWARFGCEGSDVYLFPAEAYLPVGDDPDVTSLQDVGECCGCQLPYDGPGNWHGTLGHYVTTELADMLAHLDQHRAAGHHVPTSAYRQAAEDWTEFVRPACGVYEARPDPDADPDTAESLTVCTKAPHSVEQLPASDPNHSRWHADVRAGVLLAEWSSAGPWHDGNRTWPDGTRGAR